MSFPSNADMVVVRGYWWDEVTGVGVKGPNGDPATITFEPVGFVNTTVTPNLRDTTASGYIKTRVRQTRADADTGYFACIVVSSNDPDLDAYVGRRVTFQGETPFIIEVPYNAPVVTVDAAMSAKTGLVQGTTVKAMWLAEAALTTTPPPTPVTSYLTSTQTLSTVATGIGIHNTDPSAHPDIQAAVTSGNSAASAHAARTDNPHSVTKSQVGLSNVDNTSDATKRTANDARFARSPIATAVGTRAGFYDPSRALYLPTALSLTRLRAKIGKAAQNNSLMHMLCIGDSKTAGSNAGTANSWPRQLRALLSSVGITPVGTGIVPAVNHGIDNTLDPRWAITGAWSAGTSWLAASTSGSTLTFISDVAGTTIDVFYFNNSGPFSVQIDGGTTTAMTLTGANTVGKYTVTGLSNTTHTVKMTTTSATTVYFIGVNVYPTTGLVIHNAGISGIASAGWSNTVFPSVAFAYIGMLPSPDIAVVELGTNDPTYSITATSWKTNETGAITAFGSPPTLMVCESNTNIAGANWPSFQVAHYDVADTLGIPLLDLTDRWGTAANANSLGLLGTDSSHETAVGHADVARAITRILA